MKLAAAFLLLATPALAADFGATKGGPDGVALPSCAEALPACALPMTLGKVASSALFASFPDESDPRGGGLSGEEKVKRAALGLKIYVAGELALSAEETALVKKVIAKGYGPLIVHRAWVLLDPTEKK